MERKIDRQAYLIIAFNNFKQLSMLMSLLDHPYTDIFVFIDKKSQFSDSDRKYLVSGINKSNVYFVPRINTYWGDFSLVNAELILFENAYKTNSYSYYHLLSGSDMPLVPETTIFDFFDKNRNKIFINLGEVNENVKDRVRYRQVFIKYRKRSKKNKVIVYSAKVANKLFIILQKILKINLIKKYKVEVSIASQWVSLDQDTVKLILNNKKWITKVFSKSICSDELFIPTLLNKYPKYKEKIWEKVIIPNKSGELFGNLRYINWWSGSPYTWKDGDEMELDKGIKSGNLFSRKFDFSNTPQLRNYIIARNNELNSTFLKGKL